MRTPLMESCRFVHQTAVLLSASVRQVVASSLVFELGTPANPLPVLWLLSLLLLLDKRLQWHVQVACRCSSLLLTLQLRPRFFHCILFARSLSTVLIALFSSGWAAGFSSTALLLLLSLLLLQLSSLSLLLLALLLLLPLLWLEVDLRSRCVRHHVCFR